MSISELSDDDLVVMLLAQEVRRLDRDLILERRTKNEIVARYERVVSEKQSLETRVALLEADLKRLKWVQRKNSEPACTPCPPIGSHESSFLGIP